MSSIHTSVHSYRALLAVLTVVALVFVALPVQAQTETQTGAQIFELESPDWRFQLSVAGYLMGMDGSVGGTAELPPGSGEIENVEVDFGQLTEYGNLGGSLRLEAQKHRWSILTDLQFLNVDVEQDVRDPEDATQAVLAKNKMGQAIWELTGAYLFAEHWDFLLSGRLYSFDNDLKVGDIQVLDGRETWFDIYTGLRFRNEVWEHWLLSFRGDVGMGGSKVATYFDLRGRYTFDNEKLWFEVGLRANYSNRETGNPTFDDYYVYKATTSGFFLALGYTF